MIEILNDGALALLISLGHRTGLFDAMAGRPPATAQEIADAAGLGDRRVQEWLDAMVRSGIVSSDPASNTYALPPEHAACLSGASGPGNLAALADYIPLLCAEEDRIVEHFQKSGHMPYSARPCFRHLLSKAAHESDQAVVAAWRDCILPLVPGLADALRSGIDVLDIGCGNARALNLLAATFPRSCFRGYDRSQRHIDRALLGAFWLGLSNVYFDLKDVAELDEAGAYDLITDFDSIRGQPRPRQALENVARALRPGGVFLMQEVVTSSPLDEVSGFSGNSPVRTAASLVGTDDPGQALRGEARARSLLLEVGFERVDVHRLPQHVHHWYFVATRGSG